MGATLLLGMANVIANLEHLDDGVDNDADVLPTDQGQWVFGQNFNPIHNSKEVSVWLWTILSLSAYAGSIGPDIWGYSYIDSLELDGPPFGILDLSSVAPLPILVTSSRAFRCPSRGVGTVRSTPWPMSPQTAFFLMERSRIPKGFVRLQTLGMGWLLSGTIGLLWRCEQPNLAPTLNGFGLEWAGDHAVIGGWCCSTLVLGGGEYGQSW